MKVSLVVTTYNRPDALSAVLATIRRQTRLPTETLIVDDGSDDSTSEVVERSRAAVPGLRHLWREHAGFRVSAMRNRGIAAATGDYIVLIDGDMVLQRRFIEDHVAGARPGMYVQGVRIDLSAAATEAYLTEPFAIRPWHLGKWMRAKSLIRSRLLSRCLTAPPGVRLSRIHSCNQSFWRCDLQAVNGFDERFHGFGGEDIDLCARLGMLGVRQLRLRNLALAYHLYHPPGANWRKFLKVQHHCPRAAVGLDQYCPASAQRAAA